MANMSYLCGTNRKTIYPSFVDREYDSDKQTIASDVYCVPLLWMALFRPEDIVRKTFTVESEKVTAEAPIVARKKAIGQLEEAIPYFNRLFKKEGSLDEYGAFLREGLEAIQFKYVTIELQEIAWLWDSEQAFYDAFREVLSGIGNDFSAFAKKQLVYIAQFQKLRRFPPARFILDGMKATSDNDDWNHCRVLGAGGQSAAVGLPVPWEPE